MKARTDRFFLVDSYARYVAAFGEERLATVLAGSALTPRPAAEVETMLSRPRARSVA